MIHTEIPNMPPMDMSSFSVPGPYQLGTRTQPLETFATTIPQIDVSLLHKVMDFATALEYPVACRATPLDQWRMETHDSPIFRYLYRSFRPERHLEFGTWQGAGTVYCLEECDATVWTINLPLGESMPGQPEQNAYNNGNSYDLNLSSLQDWARRIGFPQQGNYRSDSFGFIGRFYVEKDLGHRVCQIYADSIKWDARHYPEGFFDSALIDGGHTAEIVCHDTLKALHLVRSGGMILWHDCCPPVWNRFACTQGVLAGIQMLAPVLKRELKALFWIQPSWILLGIKR